MSIADKLTAIAENQQKVYEAGQKSMIDESKIIEKTATGTGVVALDDVSELPHDISVQLTGGNVGGKEVSVSHRVLDENGLEENNDFSSLSPMNVCTKIDDTTYSLIPNDNGQIYAIGVDVTSLSLNIGDVLHCRADEISKKGTDHGWRVLYADGSYSTISRSLARDVVVDKPIKKLYLYCDMGTQGFSYEPIIFSGVHVVREYEIREQYISNADGKIEGIKSISPNMSFICDEVDISVTYHKSWGMQTEYDRFWDCFQHDGERVAYDYAFYRWKGNAFYPKHDIKPTTMLSFMQYFSDDKPVDLAERLKECGVVLDTSNNKNFNRSFYWTTSIRRLPELSFESATDAGYCFGSNEELVTIDCIVLPEDGSHVSLATSFSNAIKLQNITVRGTIGSSINFKNSPLSVDSMKNIINHLKNFANTEDALRHTITFSSGCMAALEADSAAPGGGTWREYVTATLGWNI